MTQIVYSDKLPAEVRSAVEPLLVRHASILPDWCHRLTVYYDAAGKDAFSASTNVDWPYRKASVYLHAGFLSNSNEVRERDVVHELFHVVTASAFDFAWREMKRVLTPANEMLSVAMREEFTDHVEGVVQDLCNLYLAGRLSHPATAARIEV